MNLNKKKNPWKFLSPFCTYIWGHGCYYGSGECSRYLCHKVGKTHYYSWVPVSIENNNNRDKNLYYNLKRNEPFSSAMRLHLATDVTFLNTTFSSTHKGHKQSVCFWDYRHIALRLGGAVVTFSPLTATAWVWVLVAAAAWGRLWVACGMSFTLHSHPQKGSNLFHLEPFHKANWPGQNLFWVM